MGAGAGELIVPSKLGVTRKLNIRAFAGTIIPYPALAEVGKRAAMTYFTPVLTSRFVQRMILLLRRLG